jgi:hypothetical protein
MGAASGKVIAMLTGLKTGHYTDGAANPNRRIRRDWRRWH